jgi:hypothetical protein
VDGVLHREGGLPAISRADGVRQWWVYGKLHREDDLPAVINADDSQEWWVNGRRCKRRS